MNTSAGRRESTAIALVLVAGLALSACATPLQTPELPEHCEGRLVSLDEAKALMQTCRVTRIGQPHAGPVLLHLDEGSRLCFVQPQLDWVVNFANGVCPDAPIQVFIE